MTIAATGTQRSRPFLPPGFICWHVAEYYTSPKEGGRRGTGGRNRGGGLCVASIVSTPTYYASPPLLL